MTVQILYDNQTIEAHLESGWGFSCLIGGEVLFDTGESGPALLKNLKRLDISPEDINAVVLSHPHWDHTGGLFTLLEQRPGIPVYIPAGAEKLLTDLKNLPHSTLTPAPEPTVVGPVITTGTFLGEHKGAPMPEQGVTVYGTKGVSLITGCAHPGILTMAENVVARQAGQPLYALIGGFHLLDFTRDEVQRLFYRLKQLGFRRIIATHCSGDSARELSDYRTGVGDIIAL